VLVQTRTIYRCTALLAYLLDDILYRRMWGKHRISDVEEDRLNGLWLPKIVHDISISQIARIQRLGLAKGLGDR
jgi:hypothetical protein